MQMWKAASSAVAVMGVAALALVWAPAVSGQQHEKSSPDVIKRKAVVVQEGPGRSLSWTVAGGVRIGVSIRDLTADDVARMKLPGPAGVLVDEVEKDAPAAKAGVLKNDVIVSFDGEAVRSRQQLTRVVRETAEGRTVKMTVIRDGKRVELSVTPASAPDPDVQVWLDETGHREMFEKQMEKLRPELERKFEFHVQPHEGGAPMLPHAGQPGPGFRWFGGGDGPDVFALPMGRGRLGVTVQDLSPDLADFFGVKDGALVASVGKDTPAARAGVKAGDVITAIDGTAVQGTSGLVAQLREKSGDVSVTVMRDKKPLTLKATLEKPEQLKRRMVVPGVPS